jgi:PAS domain S-box-containing protein
MVGQKIWGWSPIVDELVWAELRQAASRGPVIDFESTIRLPDGAERLIAATLDFQHGGEDRFVIVYVRDITEQRAVEERVAESEARYAAVFEKNRAIKLVIDPFTAEIVDANPAACELYGYSHEELLALKITDVNAASEADVAEALARTASELVTRFVARHRLASGELRDVEVNSGPFEVGGRTLLFSIVQDVTDRSRAEEALHKSEAMYRRIVDLAGEGIWGMDGEYRTTFVNPQIAAMLGYESQEMLAHVVIEFMFEEDAADHGARMRERRRGSGGPLPAAVQTQGRRRGLDGRVVHPRDRPGGRVPRFVRHVRRCHRAETLRGCVRAKRGPFPPRLRVDD